MSALPGSSDVNLFRYREGIVYLNAEVSYGAFNLGVAEQELYGSQVAGSAVDQRRLCSPKGMRTKKFQVQPDTGDPFRQKPCILPRGHALTEAAPTRE